MFICKRCDGEATDGVTCSLCAGQFDFPCSGISETGWRNLGEDRRNSWKCSTCKTQAAASRRLNAAKSDTETIPSELRRLSAQMEALPALLENVKAIQVELAELKSIREEFTNIKTSVEFMSNSMDSLNNRVLAVEAEIVSLKSSKEEISALQNRCDRLEILQRENEQRSRMSNVEIKGVPIAKDENLFEIVNKLGDIINCHIPKEQINYIARVPMRGDTHNKNIICSIHNNYIKNDFVAAAKKLRGGINPGLLGLQGVNKIFINDHLTIENKTLLNKTKSLAKERGYEFVWVTGCKIYIRKNQTSPKRYVRSEQDLMKFF